MKKLIIALVLAFAVPSFAEQVEDDFLAAIRVANDRMQDGYTTDCQIWHDHVVTTNWVAGFAQKYLLYTRRDPHGFLARMARATVEIADAQVDFYNRWGCIGDYSNLTEAQKVAKDQAFERIQNAAYRLTKENEHEVSAR